MKKNNFFILSIILIFLSNTAIAGKLYKWVDENGKISFADKIQPKDSRREREELNTKGRTIAVKDAAKTPEQIKQSKKIKALQKTQEKILQEQLAKDSALLKTFRSESDIDTLANSKFEMISSHITIATGQSETFKKQLIQHQKNAARFEREGKNIPAKTIANLASAQAQFDKNKQEIADLKQQQKDIAKQFANDKARLKTLKASTTEKPSIHSETIPSLLLGQLSCAHSFCDDLWTKANQFITTKGAVVIFNSNQLVLTKTPRLSNDRGLSLTKVTTQTNSSITLDIRCADSKGGKATCKNEQTVLLIKEFNQLAD
ncbi:MAG: hypothetical protein A6F70_02770 [Cycloclasticus sp. symbiont of Bathymodiolus heckerae]|nr:MAG: hypothetical protein A6F70_02770 [Cycloclasticus sp. symbiont of Bathymodiolus heckerae]